MLKFSYLMRVFRGARLKHMNEVIDQVHEKTGKGKVGLFFDIIQCAVRYGAGYHDYAIFAFYNMDHPHRKTYITRMKNKKINTYLNDSRYESIFDDKREFYTKFRKYLKRDFLIVEEMNEEQFHNFLGNKEVIFAKPARNESGKGIEKLSVKNFRDEKELFDYIKDPVHEFDLVEDAIVQHEDMNRLYPLSINSLRIVTDLDNDGKTVLIPYVVVKMGNEGKFVDNLDNSGLACPVDPETGKIYGVAHTSKLINYDTHPYTHVKLIGYQIPYVKEALELVKEAALVVPQMRHVGWDVCILQDGPAIIEGNNYPGYDFFQLPEHTPDQIGLLPFYQKIVPGI